MHIYNLFVSLLRLGSKNKLIIVKLHINVFLIVTSSNGMESPDWHVVNRLNLLSNTIHSFKCVSIRKEISGGLLLLPYF